MMSVPSLPSLAFALLVVCAPMSHAETLFSTAFDTRSPEGWQAYREPRPARLDAAEGFLEVNSVTAFRGTFLGLPKVVTLKKGESLSLSFRFRLSALSPGLPAAFRFGLFRHAPGDSEEAGEDQGFFATLGESSGETLLTLQEDRGGRTFDPLSGSTRKLSEKTVGLSLEEDVWYEAGLRIRALDDTTLEITGALGSHQVTVSHTTLASATIGSIFIGSGNTNARFALDDITVTRNAP